LKEAVHLSGCGGLGNKDRCFNQSSLCNAACAQGMVSGIIDSALVNHGPVGCTVDAIGANITRKYSGKMLGFEERNTHFVGTDMNEQDTIFGALGKLREVVRETYRRYKPAAIFVSTSCVSGVIGEDVQSVIKELQAEIPVPITPVFCEGFKSKIWATGFDMAFHAILTGIVQPPKEKNNIVNFINFFGSEKKQITELFARFGVEPLFLPNGATIEQLSKLSESAATVSICGTLGTYLGNGLQQEYGVPYVQSLRPHGISGFDEWLHTLGGVLGKEAEVEQYLEEERARVLPELDKVKAKLKGLRAVIGMGPGYTFNFIRVLQELGLEIVWASSWHLDPGYDGGQSVEELEYLAATDTGNVPLSVSDQQNYELMNILQTLKPDIYFSRHTGTTVWALKQGTASVCVMDEYTSFGYGGTLDFAYMIHDAVTNRSLANKLSKRTKLPYTEWWYQQHPNFFLNEGVGARG
jgi:nitrogenase molybdenum-iron protein alpha chain